MNHRSRILSGCFALVASVRLFAAASATALPTDSPPRPAAELATPTAPTTGLTPSQSANWDEAKRWINRNLFQSEAAPFSFDYQGKNSKEFLSSWEITGTRKKPPGDGPHVLTYRDKQTGLEVRCEATVFKDFPAVEWVLKFKNTGGTETPLLSNIQALDARWRSPDNQYTLHHALGVGEGVAARAEDFRPLSRKLEPGSSLRMAPLHGRSSWGDSLPFFNVEMTQGQGVILGIGWTGQWLADFKRDTSSLNIRAGMELTRLKLYPGEEIRTPKVLLLFWQGHRIYGQNLLRRMVLAHYHPNRDGKPLTMPFLASSAGLYHEAFEATEKNQLEYAVQMKRLGVDHIWMDVGWHDAGPRKNLHSHIGPIDRQRFPNGFKPLTDGLKRLDMGLLVWFAPEFQGGASWMERAHPEMFLRIKDKDPKVAPFSLLNFGDKNALALITQHTSTMIQKEGIGIYRLDGPVGANLPSAHKQPLQWWRDADAPDRQGITEIRYIEGLYAFWDELLKNNPGLIIDLCGGGATRIDLEAMSRGVYLWRSDWNHPGFEPEGYQAHSYGVNLWLPSTAIASGYPDTYSFRSSINNGVVLAWNPFQPTITQSWPLAFPVKQAEPYTLKKIPRTLVDGVTISEGYGVSEPFPWAKAEQLTQEFKRIRPFFYGDFYPLTPYAIAKDTWTAFQYHKEDLRQGILLVFRRSQCTQREVVLNLWGLRPGAHYEVHFEDTQLKRRFTGKELSIGLRVQINEQPGSALISYRQLR